MIKLLRFVLLILFGIFIIVYGGIDDSPGAQGLGLLAIIIGAVIAISSRKKKTKSIR